MDYFNFRSAWIIVIFIFTTIVPMDAFYYGYPRCFVEDSYLVFEQTNPDIAYDGIQNLNVVWSDTRDGYRHIYHRMSYLSMGGILTNSIRADQVTSCVTFQCYLDNPHICFGVSNGLMVCSGGTTHPYIDSSTVMYTTPPSDPSWFYVGTADPGTGGPFYSTAMASNASGSYLVHQHQGGLRVVWYNGGSWDANDYVLTPPTMDVVYNNPDIAMDDDGYIYIAYDYYDGASGQHRILTHRSIQANNISSGFAGARIVGYSYYEPIDAHPSLAATGSIDSLTLAVTVAYTFPDGGYPNIFCICEENGPWVSTPTPLNGTPEQVSSFPSGSSYTPGFADVAYGINREIHVVWQDNRSGHMKIYGAVAFSPACYFFNDRMISVSGDASESAEKPQIAFNSDKSEYAVAYQQKSVNALYHIYVADNNPVFFDSCDSGIFEYWSSHTGVEISTFGHNGAGYKLRTNSLRGELVRDFGTDRMTGSVDFWFYDSLSTTEDLQMRIEGDDGSKAGVYRMMGINNATTSANYSIHTGSSWTDSGVSRGSVASWHHGLVLVSDTGIEMYIDPESNITPVHSSTDFVWFNRVSFQGGSDSSPYYLDDVRIEGITSYDVPAAAIPGLIFMTVLFSLMLRLNLRRIRR